MKFLKSFLAVLLLFVSLGFSQPAFADRPNFANNPDYIEITQALTNLKATITEAGADISAETQKQIDGLEFQKYALESGINWGQCRNETGETLAVYGSKRKKEGKPYQTALYFLGNGQVTDREWDCDGIYLPNDAKTEGLGDLGGAAALKIVDGTQLVAKTNPETGVLELSTPPFQVLKAGEGNWFIPNVSQADLDTRLPNAPIND